MSAAKRCDRAVTPVVVVCAADSAYAMALAVMLQSISAHVDPARRVDVYIIDCGLSLVDRARIDGQQRPNLCFHWRPSKRSKDIDDTPWGHVSGATYDRLLIEQYLPADTALALWLDCDLLVLDDITVLFNQPLLGSTLWAVRDPFVHCVSSPFGVCRWRELDLASHAPYFNAGVMLIDMARWRSSAVATRALQYIRQHGKHVFFYDQEALNAVAAEHWQPLDDRWNYSANPFHAIQQDLGGGEPAILHFAGRIKPWIVPNLGVTQDRFFEQLDNTLWRGTRPARSAKMRLLSWYVRSRLRNLTYPLENQHLRLRHYLGI